MQTHCDHPFRTIRCFSHSRSISLSPGPIGAVIGVVVVVAVVAVVGVAVTQINSSGRGLDVDEWEMDHSVWMNQLQRDFEDSWGQE